MNRSLVLFCLAFIIATVVLMWFPDGAIDQQLHLGFFQIEVTSPSRYTSADRAGEVCKWTKEV